MARITQFPSRRKQRRVYTSYIMLGSKTDGVLLPWKALVMGSLMLSGNKMTAKEIAQDVFQTEKPDDAKVQAIYSALSSLATIGAVTRVDKGVYRATAFGEANFTKVFNKGPEENAMRIMQA